jgi:hypothetical protein
MATNSPFTPSLHGYTPFIMEGLVVDVDDKDQMGRVRVWIPGLDGENIDVEQLPWADYASPSFGSTIEYPAGNGSADNQTQAAYGFWAVPKINSVVLVFCLNGEPSRRVYFASTIPLHTNRSLPAGRNKNNGGTKGPYGDLSDGNELVKLEPAYSNLRAQFDGKVDEPEAQTRGMYERQVAQPGASKDGTDGYLQTPVKGESYFDPQTSCWVTPGRHAIIFQDHPSNSRTRIKTAEGHQVILDDANERIYVSTARGKTWLELDLDGHVHIFGAASISLRAGEDINMYADRNINLEAGKAVNVKATGGDIRLSTQESFHLTAVKNIIQTACGNVELSAEQGFRITSAGGFDQRAGGAVKITTGNTYDLRSEDRMRIMGRRIDLNGPVPLAAAAAQCATPAEAPSVVPGHEPWKRPATKAQRNKNWKP